MPARWPLATFGDLFLVPQKNGLTRPKAVRGTGTKMVNMGELFACDRLRNYPMDRVPLDEHESGFLLSAGDLLFARQSLVLEGAGRCVLFQGDHEPVTFESHIIRVRLDPARACPDYWYYWFRSPQGRRCVEAIVTQVAAAGIRGSDLSQLSVPTPPLPEQQAIASVLVSLDDRVDLNRRMNQTVEALARTIFRSWFLDFDPVRAKAAGRQPVGTDAETAALFPSGFVESELGEIPEGWEVTTLGTLCERSGGDIQTGPFGSQLHASDYVQDGIPSIMPKNLKEDRISQDGIARITEDDAARLARYRLSAGDIVYSRRGDVERCALVTRREHGWLCGTGCLRVRMGGCGAEPVYVFGAVTTDRSRSWVVRHAHGATMPNLNTAILGMLPLCAPPVSVQQAYRNLVGPLLERRDLNWDENDTLAALRDTLLSKLISGELCLAEAEAIVGEAAP